MSDAKSPAAKSRRRRLYQEIPEERAPVARPAGKASTRPVAKPTAKRAAASPVPAPLEGEVILAADVIEETPATPPVMRAGPAPLYPSPLLRHIKAKQTVRDHVLLSGGAMVIPVPFLDMAAEAAIQVRMVKRLAEIYGVDFAEERAKTLVVAALGGFSAGWAAGTLLRYANFATYFTNFWPSALLSAGITYSIGQVFIHHFEKGGGLHDLTPEQAASFLKEKAQRLRRRKPAVKDVAALA